MIKKCAYCGEEFETLPRQWKKKYCRPYCNERAYYKRHPEMMKVKNNRLSSKKAQLKYNKTEKAKLRLERYKLKNYNRYLENFRRYHLKHKDKLKIKGKQYRLKNSEKIKKYQKQRRDSGLQKVAQKRCKEKKPWLYKLKQIRDNFTRRQNLKGQSWEITTKQLEALYVRQDCCAYCGSKEKLTIHHIIPIKNNGKNELDNLVLACMKCNCSKATSNVFVWCKEKGFEVPKLVLELLEKQQKQLELIVFN